MIAREKPFCGLSLMSDPPWISAASPLFEDGEVDVVEWSFDTCWNSPTLPQWITEITTSYGKKNRLIGHGVSLSLLSVENRYQDEWLRNFERLCSRYTFSHVSEHFGFMRTRNFHFGSPLPVPYDKQLVLLAQSRLELMHQICKCPVGVENLALSLSRKDIERHASYITEIVAPIEGFILLDLHNLYCQSHNFNMTLEELFILYPVELVREIHISGGSWSEASHSRGRKIRRDTHDGAVPEEILAFLPKALAELPNLKAVIFEQLGTSLESVCAVRQFRDDFLKIKRIVEGQSYGIAR